jgi:hypothetical protein
VAVVAKFRNIFELDVFSGYIRMESVEGPSRQPPEGYSAAATVSVEGLSRQPPEGYSVAATAGQTGYIGLTDVKT